MVAILLIEMSIWQLNPPPKFLHGRDSYQAFLVRGNQWYNYERGVNIEELAYNRLYYRARN